jgi:hypothetical protein
MNFRILAVAAVTVLTMACPPAPRPDGGMGGGTAQLDGSNPTPIDACSGGCGANQICDTATRTCRDACGGCDAGVCVKVMQGVFQCRPLAVTCNNNLCEPGQVACIGGNCSCLSSATAGQDSCGSVGKWCNGTSCAPPKRLEECRIGDMDAPCPTGFTCKTVFSSIGPMCTKNCMGNNECDRGELCSSVGCLPQGLFGDQECNQYVTLPDGGFKKTDAGITRLTLPASNTCLLKDENGDIVGDSTGAPGGTGKGVGNCTYAIARFHEFGVLPLETCQPPGTATLGQTCKNDRSAGTIATQCSTGLECAYVTSNNEGKCLKMCNANPPRLGFNSKPECSVDESCVNLYRYTDPSNNSVLGVCMKSCDVFNPMKNTCAPLGASPTSCVPTSADGELIVTPNGAGVCVPQQQTVKQPGETCETTDPFKGAACGNAQLCASASADALATCTPVCDITCNPPTDGGVPPTRCATQPSAQCAGGKACKRVTSTSGARVGFCL